MKIKVALLLLLSLTGCHILHPNEQVYVAGAEDVPLPVGFKEKSNNHVAFDTAGGRIVDVLYIGKSTVTDVNQYYAETLPQLGWKIKKNNTYSREDETLQVKATAESESKVLLNVVIKPSKG